MFGRIYGKMTTVGFIKITDYWPIGPSLDS